MSKKKKYTNSITTIKIPYHCEDDSFESYLHDMRIQFSNLYRKTYKAVSTGLVKDKKLDVNHYVKSLVKAKPEIYYDMDSWLCQSVMILTLGQITADKEIHKENPNFKRIHGGKKNFHKRRRGVISKEEWQELRLCDLSIEGEAPQGGNRKFNFNRTSITFKPKKGISFELHFDVKELRGNWSIYDKMFEYANNKRIPIKVTLDKKYIYLSVNNEKIMTCQIEDDAIALGNKTRIGGYLKHNTGNYVGIDCNPNSYGIVYYDKSGKLLHQEVYTLHSMTGKHINHDKLLHEVRELSWAIIRKCEHYQIDYVIGEDLSFSQGNKGNGKNFNRLCTSQFLYNEFFRLIAKKVEVLTINAAYSSTIGNLMHSDSDPIAAAKEVARRGKSCLLDRNYSLFYPLLRQKYYVNLGLKSHFIDWKTLHDSIKKSGLRYRNPLTTDGFENYSSHKSLILLGHD